MGLFERLGRSAQPRRTQQGQPDPRQMQQQMQQDLREIKANPGSYLKNMGYDVPDGMTDAGQITEYLLRTRQIGTPRIQQVAAMLGGGRR